MPVRFFTHTAVVRVCRACEDPVSERMRGFGALALGPVCAEYKPADYSSTFFSKSPEGRL